MGNSCVEMKIPWSHIKVPGYNYIVTQILDSLSVNLKTKAMNDFCIKTFSKYISPDVPMPSI